MDKENLSQQAEPEGGAPECECPEPCNCDHDNE
jgi:hypothetical protein